MSDRLRNLKMHLSGGWSIQGSEKVPEALVLDRDVVFATGVEDLTLLEGLAALKEVVALDMLLAAVLVRKYYSAEVVHSR